MPSAGRRPAKRSGLEFSRFAADPRIGDSNVTGDASKDLVSIEPLF